MEERKEEKEGRFLREKTLFACLIRTELRWVKEGRIWRNVKLSVGAKERERKKAWLD